MSFPQKRESREVMKKYFVYILASKRNGTLYIGVTNDLIRRVYEHKNNLIGGFTNKYNVHRLVYYEQFDNIEYAIQREKRLKKWNRTWKLKLIEKENPIPTSVGMTLLEGFIHRLSIVWIPAFAGMTGRGKGMTVSGKAETKTGQSMSFP